jgi:hypothetical protein
MTETKEEWRAVLMSTKDYAYRNRTVDVISEDDSVSIPIPDDEVLCNACNGNIYPNNGWMMEYKEIDETPSLFTLLTESVDSDIEDNDAEGWKTYDIYCETCQEKYFPDAQKCIVDDSGVLSP